MVQMGEQKGRTFNTNRRIHCILSRSLSRSTESRPSAKGMGDGYV